MLLKIYLTLIIQYVIILWYIKKIEVDNKMNRKVLLVEPEYKNKYPFVFVGGMLSWGEENGMYKLPYWGMVCGNLVQQLRDTGIEAYAPQVGPMNSAWDRACNLYAMLTGTRVDYGVAHSKKNNHARYGRTYAPLVQDWGKELPDGGIKKVHLLGHSFGGATMRMLAELLTNGSEEERQAQMEAYDYIKSIATFPLP